MALRNPFKARLNDVTDLPCAHNHLAEAPHPKYRFAPDIGWFVRDEESGEFLWSARPFGDDRFKASREEGAVKTGKHSFVWCLCDMPQGSVDSIPGSHEPVKAHTGFGAHWNQYANPATLRHYRSYAGSIPTSMGAGKWVLENHPKEL